MQKLLSLAIVFAILAWTVDLAANAQVYQNLGPDMVVGSDGSMAQRLGDNAIVITQPPQFNGQFGYAPLPPRQTLCQRLGNSVICN